MHDAWREVRLGDIFEPTNRRLGEHVDEPEIFSVTKYDGFVPAEEYFGKRIASAKLDTYKIVEADEWAYSTIHINEGSIARNRLGRRGVVSPMYTTMRLTTDQIDPYYAELVMRSPWMLARYGDAQQGSINRRRSLPWKTFASLAIPLPTPQEQRRIVDLIGAVDDTIAATGKAADSALTSRERMLESVFSRGERVDVGSLVDEIQGGRSPKAVDVPPGPDESGVLKVSAVTSSGFVAEAAKRLEDTSPFSPHHRVSSGDVLITRANTAEKVGQVCLVDRDYPNLYLSDKTLRLIPADGASPAALVAAMNAPLAREQLSSMSTGTSASMKNVSQQDIRRVRIAWPENAPAMGELDQIFLTTYRKHSDMLDHLRALRANLLTALLSGEHEIPVSYDAVMRELVGTGR